MAKIGRPVQNGDYAKPLFTRLYREDRKKLDQLIRSFPLIPKSDPRKANPGKRKITDSEVVRIAITHLHTERVVNKKV